ncbi:membrane protein [Aureimonas sp. SA4125]|uniref:OpgC family protein n=1 Tax=Aureimonas sp. SA4125 TaxID=2826993 RepID=UPI001CC56C7B|nr:OpgC domain-containing protein [Aureimonas sp. SA4125]BDA82604.1 membrane protein [Aureimonas sp. SA4125]
MSLQTTQISAGGRDHRVDFYRGIALAMIFVNHVPGTLWENFTSRNFGFSDAAELFVFLAGFASAFAYGKPFLAGGRLVASLKSVRRAGVLYLVHITLTMAAIGIFAWATLAFGHGNLMQQLGIEMLMSNPIQALLGIATLGLQIGYVNILPMYSVILLMMPVMLLVAALFGRGAMLGLSVAFWIVTGVLRLDLPTYPQEGGWFFNPLAWQVLFAAGLYCGLAKWQRGYAVAYNPWIYGAALFYLLVSFACVRFEFWGFDQPLGLPFLIGDFDKTYVTLPRLMHLLAVVYVFAQAPRSSPLSTISPKNPLAVIGRHSLPIFAVGTVLSLACQIIRIGRDPSPWFDTLLLALGLAILFALGNALDWWRKAAVQRTSPAAGVLSTARGERSPALPPQTVRSDV